MSSEHLQSLREQGINPNRPAYHDTPLLSVGKQVRVQKADSVRRAEIEYIDEADNSAEVAYLRLVRAAIPSDAADEPEVETVPSSFLQPLEEFELQPESVWHSLFEEDLYRAAASVKEDGNKLFKLKDYAAAADHYSIAVTELRALRPSSRQDCWVLVNRGGSLMLGGAQLVDASGRADVFISQAGRQQTVHGAPWKALLPVHEAQLALHASLYMNRSRCLSQLALHSEAAQDLSVAISLWAARGEPVRQELSEAEAAERREQIGKAHYLRAKARLARMRCELARADIQMALDTEPPEATVKLLRHLEREVDAAKKEQLRSNRRLAKEIAKFADSAMEGLDQEALESFGRALPDLDLAA